MEHLIIELAIIYFLSAFAGIILARFKIPNLIVYMIIGFLIGPFALKVIPDVEIIHVLAEIGIVLLLFGLGIEFSLHKLLTMDRRVYIIGIGQIIATLLLSFALARLFGTNLTQALFFSCIITLSSTAIVLQILVSNNEIDSHHGQIAIGLMILQDLAVVPMIILLPLLQNQASSLLPAISWAGIKIIGFLLIIFFAGKLIIRKFFYLAITSGSKELLLLAAISVSLGIALISDQFGLSLALGAFFAGLLISESDYAHHLFTDLIPFRDAFSCLFFTSIGMWIQPKFLLENFALCFSLVFGVILLKIIIGCLITRLTKFTWHTSIMTGLLIAQIGEFSFILIQLGWGLKLFSQYTFQLIISVSSLSMLFSPFLYYIAKNYFYWWLFSKTHHSPQFSANVCPISHIIICGSGTVGKKLYKLLNQKNIPSITVSLDYKKITELTKQGISAVFGDAADPRVLKLANITCAKAVVLTFADDYVQARAIKKIKELHPGIPVIGRLHYESKRTLLEKSGISDLISEELEVAEKLAEKVEPYIKPLSS
ncbi:MAG: cation:proton antiporter [bacterium]